MVFGVSEQFPQDNVSLLPETDVDSKVVDSNGFSDATCMLERKACTFRCITWTPTVAAAHHGLDKLHALALQTAKRSAVRVVEYEGNVSKIFILIQ